MFDKEGNPGIIRKNALIIIYGQKVIMSYYYQGPR